MLATSALAGTHARANAPEAAEAALAAKILAATGVEGGLVAHVGCGNGRLTAALLAGERYLVHGLDADADRVREARRHIRQLGLYGRVSVDAFDGNRLPYADNLVNLLVAEDLQNVPGEEVRRVLAPGGVAYVKAEGKWCKTTKPRPGDIDSWTHYLHGPDNNAVAADRVVGEPRSIQWVAAPRFGRSHEELASMSAAVTAAGRIFAIVDEAPFTSIRFRGQWRLAARDAFNGLLLWKREIPVWNDHLRHFRSGPVHLQRRLVAVGDRVYATLGLAAPVTALRAATGRTERVYEGTEHTEEILVDRGVLYLVVGTSENDRTGGGLFRRGEPERSAFRFITAIDAESGRSLWKYQFGKADFLLPLSLAVDGESVYFQSTRGVARLDAKSGSLVWRTPRPTLAKRMGFSAPTLVATEKILLCADREPASNKPETAPTVDGRIAWGVHGWAEPGFPRRGPSTLRAYSVDTGKEIWNAQCTEQYNAPTDVFVVDGQVWVGSNFRGYDLETGALVRELPWKGDPVAMPHHRCYRNKATERFLFTGRSGVEVVSLDEGWIGNNSWIRGTCQYGVMPANGLVYAPPDACACFSKVKVFGFFAAAPARASDTNEPEPTRLVKGPAYDRLIARRDRPPTSEAADWPMYRHDNTRSGCATTPVPASLKRKWSTKLGGLLTQPIVAGGRVFLAQPNTHAVHALDAGRGQRLWSFTAGARIDSSPTFYRGTILFGSADGSVYCLDADDGTLAWRFHAAPKPERIVAFEQLESIWPVHGSVLIQNDTLYVTAGRNSYLDGGMTLYRIDPVTGAERSRTPIYHLDPGTGRQTGHEGPRGFDMDGVRSDLLSGDGESIFLKHFQFDRSGSQIDSTTPHLFSIRGFVGEEWFVRSYWILATGVGAGWGYWADAAATAPAGRILAFDHDTIFGYGRTSIQSGPVGHRADAYHLWCRDRKTGPAVAPPKKESAPAKKRSAGKKPRKPPRWSEANSLIVRAMTLATNGLIVAGPLDLGKKTTELLAFENEEEALAGFRGQRGVFLRMFSTDDGSLLREYPLEAMPVFDGMSAAQRSVFLALKDGTVICLGDAP